MFLNLFIEQDSEANENAADFIKLDVSRTFSQLGIFQEVF